MVSEEYVTTLLMLLFFLLLMFPLSSSKDEEAEKKPNSFEGRDVASSSPLQWLLLFSSARYYTICSTNDVGVE